MNPTIIRTDYAAVNSLGVTLCTFGDLDHAFEWVAARRSEHRDLHVEKFTIRSQRVDAVYKVAAQAVAA